MSIAEQVANYIQTIKELRARLEKARLKIKALEQENNLLKGEVLDDSHSSIVQNLTPPKNDDSLTSHVQTFPEDDLP